MRSIRTRLRAFAASLLLTLLSATAMPAAPRPAETPAAAPYTFIQLDVPGAQHTWAYDVNEAGDVAGYFTDSLGVIKGFRYEAGTYETIYYPDSYLTFTLGIANGGLVTGYYQDGDTGYFYGYTFDTTWNVFNYPGYGDPDEGFTFPAGINDMGLVVGFYNDEFGEIHGFTWNGVFFDTFDYPGSDWTYVLDVNNLGDFAGTCEIGGVEHGWLYWNDQWILGPAGTELHGINDLFGIIGEKDGASFYRHDGQMFWFPGPATAVNVNDNGDIVGYFEKDGTHGFLLLRHLDS